MNYFVAATALLWFVGAIQYVLSGNTRMAIVSICYAVATIALIGAK